MGRGLGHGDRVPMNGVTALMREAPEGSLPPLPCEPTGRGQWSLPRKRPSPDMELAGTNLRRCSFLHSPTELRTGGLLLSRCSAQPGSCPGLLASPPYPITQQIQLALLLNHTQNLITSSPGWPSPWSTPSPLSCTRPFCPVPWLKASPSQSILRVVATCECP